MRRVDLAGAAHLEFVSGVAQLRPEEAMLRGWRVQQVSRRLREDTITVQERLIWSFVEFTNEYPCDYGFQWEAIVSISEKVGVSAESLRRWVRQAEVDAGQRAGTSSGDAKLH